PRHSHVAARQGAPAESWRGCKGNGPRKANACTPSRTPGANLPGVRRMKRRLVIITEIISPYRIPLFNGLAQDPNVDLHVIFLAETDPNLRQWRGYQEEDKLLQPR